MWGPGSPISAQGSLVPETKPDRNFYSCCLLFWLYASIEKCFRKICTVLFSLQPGEEIEMIPQMENILLVPRAEAPRSREPLSASQKSMLTSLAWGEHSLHFLLPEPSESSCMPASLGEMGG